MAKNSKIDKFLLRSLVIVTILCFGTLFLHMFNIVNDTVYLIASIIMSLLIVMSGVIHLWEKQLIRGIIFTLIGIILLISNIGFI
ncbi:hypothetical protein J3T78_08035 [Staphylococcus nepalensis]|jgi:hypothetical protein|uniref:DUF3953 domain-containing protein n=1 Tax=Staphylococcus nepalensis TaxID=214473 RepID=A0ABS3L1Y6_9STAP|nr:MULTISPECIES: hypothetical protein [Staphylococcus]MBO1214668.1 hypothetical protein [Staphylococcus nepalensis]MBO1216700.1 hypothetical protein [Staphylococcus nepalensis]MBO1227556.1 hypothetical protein [Staphylococcus nepalensis]MBO1235634.1 hypothetical protein [Staphylococcus nepalensis]MBO1237669.1 hypothetical protein [Staphylococcus nepalensis]